MKVLVIGYGSIGKRHVSNLLTIPGVEVMVVTKQADAFLHKKKCKIFTTIEKSIKEKPDAAIISNVTSLHVETAIKLAKLGIHLFIEKPLSSSLKRIDTLLDLVKKRKIVTLIGCNFRFHPCIQKIKEIITKNEIGRIISVHVENGSFLPDWHPHEDYRKSYASRKDLGGGVVLTNIHEIDYLFWFFGAVKDIFSVTGKYSDLQIKAEDLSSIIMKFKNNVIAEVHLDYFQRPSFRGCKIIGTHGKILWDMEINEVRVYSTKKKKWIKKLSLKKYNNNDMYKKEILHFTKSINQHQKTINPIYEGVKTLKIALAIKKSSTIKRMVHLD